MILTVDSTSIQAITVLLCILGATMAAIKEDTTTTVTTVDIMAVGEEMVPCLSELAIGAVVRKAVIITILPRMSTACVVVLPELAQLLSLTKVVIHRLWLLLQTMAWVHHQWVTSLVQDRMVPVLKPSDLALLSHNLHQTPMECLPTWAHLPASLKSAA